MSCSRLQLLAPLACALATACTSDVPVPLALAGVPPSLALAESEWSAPVNLGAPINTAAGEMNAAFSQDDMSIYFTSNRTGGVGGNDIWVSRRACIDCPWSEPFNLAPINTAGVEAGPRISIDGHLLFFQSDRPGGQGDLDIYVSRRANTNDDLAWSAPVNLGPGVNTAGLEQAAAYLQSAEDGGGNLYFNGGPAGGQDIYYAGVGRDGQVRTAAVLVAELSDPAAIDQHAAIRRDGREVFIARFPVGASGANFDLLTATRQSVHHSWSALTPLAINTAANEQQPSLSHTGRVLLFASNRSGGQGGNDLWISERRP
jgi:hypothetical protein